ncbi:MAG TPA: FmdB family zinc ribbon protein [Spirochaetota bacterium]|nr:FmdB family zinc ribbon protein [Spirochaetota bacterium]
MPTYEYYCPDCQQKYNKFQPISAKPYIKCPNCGKKINRSIAGGTGIIFKGSGFYTTDYKKKEKSGQSSPAAAEGEKKETKPAAADKDSASAQSGNDKKAATETGKK